MLTQDELNALKSVFDIHPAGNFEGHIVLQRGRADSLAETVQVALDKLFQRRYGNNPSTSFLATTGAEARGSSWPGRIPPVTDTKIIVAWNALMISGLAKAAQMLGQTYLQLAIEAAKALLEHQWVDRKLYRLNYAGQASVSAQAKDYALLIKACLDLQQATLSIPGATHDIDWLQVARDIQAEFDIALWSWEHGGYYNTCANNENLLLRERSFQDSATPSANGVAMANLVRLSLLTGDLSYRERAEQGLNAFGAVIDQIPQACASLITALDWYRHGTVVKTTSDVAAILLRTYYPVVAFSSTSELPANATALVCPGMSCIEPAQTLEQTQTQIRESVG